MISSSVDARDRWIFSEAGDTLDLPAIDCHIDVAAIYEKVNFE